MERPGIEAVLARAEASVSKGGGLDGIGFWPAVARVKASRELAERYGARIAAVDQAAFRNWALLVVPIVPGTIIALMATAGGLALVGWAYSLKGITAVLVFAAGFGVVWVTTHGLGHLLVGRLLGIRFTDWFIGTLTRPQPGVKVDYESYVQAPARKRAWMHASGAIVSKLVPFAMVGAAVAADLPSWAVWALVGFGVLSLITDLLWSTRAADWKKFHREMALA